MGYPKTSLTDEIRAQRHDLVNNMRSLICRNMVVEDSDDATLVISHQGFYLQICFSELHPLMVMYFAKSIERRATNKDIRAINKLNINSVLGVHALNEELGWYTFRSTHWLDVVLSEARFFEMLTRGADEALRGFCTVTNEAG